MRKEVVIVGAGPAGLATAACLNLLSIPNVILEKEDCCASLWKKRSYDRLKLHLAKQFCELPHMHFPNSAPTFVSKDGFIEYLDNYASHFKISPFYCNLVESASYDERSGTWSIASRDTVANTVSVHTARFLVVATGENSEGTIPDIPGLKSFNGEAIHSSRYKSGRKYEGKSVLVVGCGNSGMEIAYDLATFKAKTSITIRSPLHVITREMLQLGMVLMKYLPVSLVDSLIVMQAKFKYGDLSKYGIVRPRMGPISFKSKTGKSAVLDVGTVKKIKSGEITVLGGKLSSIEGNIVVFEDGKSGYFDAIIFATGYKSIANTWLKDGEGLLNKDGLPIKRFPNHWKGKNGLYCAGLARVGLAGISMDAQNIANDIQKAYKSFGAP